METRKVQLSGGTTYTVSLPKSWAQEHGIEAGSVLSLRPNGDGSLVVEAASGRTSSEETASVDVSTAGAEAVSQTVLGLYAIGCDEVVLVDPTGHPAGRRQTVEETVEGLSGFEMLETTDTRLRLTNLVDAENVDVRKIALRLRLVALAMHRDSVTAVTNGDAALAERVVDRDSEADKLFVMVTRYFRRALSDLHEVEKLGGTRDELFEFYYTCRQFERIADHAEKIAGFVGGSGAPPPGTFADRIQSFGDRARGVIDDAADVVLADGSIETAHGAIAARDDLVADIQALDRELYDHEVPEEAHAGGLILDSLRRTAAYGGNVAEVAVQQVLREQRDSETGTTG
ncbi:MAG: PhoU domain-containing protein [Salinirussus sp.]